jgi:predicted DNA-binding transcriptional regulator AlpA
MDTLQDRLIFVDEVAYLFGVHPETIRRWVKTLGFPEPERKNMRVHRWSELAVLEWAATHNRPTRKRA